MSRRNSEKFWTVMVLAVQLLLAIFYWPAALVLNIIIGLVGWFILDTSDNSKDLYLPAIFTVVTLVLVTVVLVVMGPVELGKKAKVWFSQFNHWIDSH